MMEKSESSIQKGTFTDKVMIGLNIALRKLVVEAAANDESLVIGDKYGNSKLVPAKELLETVAK